ncbi:cytochrome P450 [Streptomyces sp. NPDC020965]|uniref:Cytochrome P450 monooxygenase n=1 Tax=Streptomyces halstedii TaxID=1944 RepID=Q0PCZ6_STRHA|nr:cytochrome P450 monooxygenase [Streptomyces halstedii]
MTAGTTGTPAGGSRSGTEQAPDFPFADENGIQLGTEYDPLLARDGLARVTMPHGGDAWIATRMADVKKVLSDPRLSRTAAARPDSPRYTPEVLPSGGVLVGLDGPEHARIRRLLGKALSVGLMEGMRPWIRETVDEILTDLLDQGPPVDLVRELGEKLPRLAICKLLGMPYSDRHRFDESVDVVVSMATRSRDEVGRAWSTLSAYIGELVEAKRREPAEDLISALLEVRHDGDSFSDREVITNTIAVLVAGYESTASELTTMAYLLMVHPGLKDSLREDPSRIPASVEEMLRYAALSPAGAMTCRATEDVTIGETEVREGDAVVPCLVAANYDQTVFDQPRELDPDRGNKGKHLAFGFGAHYCMGARLARIELQEALTGLVHRMPGLRLAVSEKLLPRRTEMGMRGFLRLPVTW